MRLLFCCELYEPSRGGVQEVMRQIAERMAAAGHDVTVATSFLPERRFEMLNGVKIRQFRASGNRSRGMGGEVDQYRDFVVEFGADAILIKAAQQWTFDALWPVLDRIAARKVFIPCGFSGLFEPAYAQYFADLPQILRKLDHLIFYAEKYRDIDFARAHGVTRLSVIPNGASELEFDRPPDIEVRTRLGIDDDEFIFLTVGSPIVGKGHGYVAEAFARLQTDGRPATLILNGSWPRPGESPPPASPARPVGGIPVRVARRIGREIRRALALGRRSVALLRREKLAAFRARVRNRIERLDTEQQITQWIEQANAQPGKRVLCTNLPRSDLVATFMAADLFVFASTIEYSPLVLFEAAAAGVPFLSVPVGNAEEIARWTGGGIICPAVQDGRGYTRVDPSVLAGEMRRCMHDPSLLRRLGAVAKDRWRERFSWRVIAPQYEAVLGDRLSAPENARECQTTA